MPRTVDAIDLHRADVFRKLDAVSDLFEIAGCLKVEVFGLVALI